MTNYSSNTNYIMEGFGLSQYQEISTTPTTGQMYFSNTDDTCVSKQSYDELHNQREFNAFEELNEYVFSAEDDAINKMSRQATHKAADALSDIGTKLAAGAYARAAVKQKSGLFADWRTKRARKKMAKKIYNQYHGVVNSASHIGADYAHEKYLKV